MAYKPIIIAHRGASGYFPEHTLEGYRAAAAMGADYIEPDLVVTKDGHLVVRHDSYLSTSTNVADKPEFLDRKRGHALFDRDDWWIEDFTLEEIRTLRARQPFKGRSREYDDQFLIPTFAEVAQLSKDLTLEHGRPVGVYPETKHPSYFKSLGLDFKVPILTILNELDLNNGDSPVFVQSFEADILGELSNDLKVPRILLLDSMREMDPDAPLTEPTYDVKTAYQVAEGIGPWKALLAYTDGRSTGLLEEAHEAGLKVHAYTFRNDQLPEAFKSPEEEYFFYMKMGVDGFFSDFSDSAVMARAAFLAGKAQD